MKEKMSEPLTLPPCRICGGTATGLHYGVNTCEACKAFFRRSLVEKNKYVCPREGDCKIINHKRANCSACRLKKCLEMGMSKKAVRHGRYTVAIRTKTILEVKQLEREQALKDSFALVDSMSKKMPEIISVPETDLEKSPTNSSHLSSSVESSATFSSLLESSFQSDTLQSMTLGSQTSHQSLESMNISDQTSDTMTSLDHTSMFSMETKMGTDLFSRMDSFDILNSLDLDVNAEPENVEILEANVFSEGQNTQPVDIDLTSDKLDFLEVNPEEFINLSQVNAFPTESTTQNQVVPSIHYHDNFSMVDQINPDTVTTIDSDSQQYSPVSQPSPDTTTKEEPQFETLTSSNMAASPEFTTLQPITSSSYPLPSTSAPPHKKLRSSYNFMDDLEQLQTINTLVMAQEILYPEMRKHFNKEYTEVIHREFMEKTQLQTELFGQLKSLSTQEYTNFFLVTGMDVDGRIGMFTKAAENMQKDIVRYISFVKSIPGWEHINNSDKLTLIKASRFEFWLLGKYLQINPEMGITANEKIGFTHKQILQMWGSPDNLDTINNFTKKIKKMDLTFEEIAMMRGIVVLSRDRYVLREPELVEKLQWNILQSFIHLLKKTHPTEPLRFARCMDKITQLRELTEINYKANKNLENFQKSLIQNYPLLYECMTFEG